MIKSITILLFFQLTGESISALFELPVPGPVIGMALLFITLVLRGEVSNQLRQTAQSLLQNLALLFVPAGVGIMLHFQRISDEWLPVLLALAFSTFASILVTALVLQSLLRNQQERS